MEYAEAIDWLYGRQQAGIKLGLDNIRRLLAALDLPAPGAKILHVAGTNGKGSTCALAESALRAAGQRTGMFTSPHLVSFCERIRIDGIPVDEQSAAAGITQLFELTESWDEQPTFFEFTTALAFVIFAERAVDCIVLEVGLGGRLDSTNAITPTACAITPIGLDHCHILGDTLGAIAGEKAGIFKSGVPAVSAPQADEARAVLEAKAAGVGCELGFVDEAWTQSPVALIGEHQAWNAALAAAALTAGGFDYDPAGFATASWPGRFEIYPGELVIDGAHNPASMEVLVSTWRAEFGGRRPTVVFGAAANKDLPDVIAPLLGIAGRFVLTKADSPRSAEPEELAALLPDGTEHVCVATAEVALGEARCDGGAVLVTGSLFLVGETVAILGKARGAYERSEQ